MLGSHSRVPTGQEAQGTAPGAHLFLLGHLPAGSGAGTLPGAWSHSPAGAAAATQHQSALTGPVREWESCPDFLEMLLHLLLFLLCGQCPSITANIGSPASACSTQRPAEASTSLLPACKHTPPGTSPRMA